MNSNISNEQRHRINAAYRSALRHGSVAQEHRDILSNDAAGASLIPQGFDTVWTDALATVSPIVNLVHKFKSASDGRPVRQVVTDSSAQFLTLVGEGSSMASDSQQPAVFSNIVDRDSLLGRIDISWQALDDSFSLESFLRSTAAVVVGKSLETAILKAQDGAGNALPNGGSGLLASSPSGFTQAHLSDGIPYGSIRGLISSLPHVYMRQPTSGLLASQSVHDYLAEQVDGLGRELYKRDPNTGNLLLNGYQLFVANDAAMPAYDAPSSNVLLAGDFSRAWGIALSDVNFRVININPQTLTSTVLFFVRYGASAMLTSAVKALTTAAS